METKKRKPTAAQLAALKKARAAKAKKVLTQAAKTTKKQVAKSLSKAVKSTKKQVAKSLAKTKKRVVKSLSGTTAKLYSVTRVSTDSRNYKGTDKLTKTAAISTVNDFFANNDYKKITIIKPR